MSIPSNVMLIRKKEKDSFFKENKLTDGISSYLTSHSSNINQYSFNNITQLINACIVDKEEARKKLVVRGMKRHGKIITTTGIKLY